MTNTYQTMITDIGAAKIAAAIATGIPLIVTTAAVGDGGGADYNPTPAQSALRHEVWRGAVAYSEIDKEDPKMLNIHFIIPPDAGGFTVREAGLFDEAGTLLAVCNLPATKKELYTSGTTGKLTIIMHIVVADAGAVEVVIQPDLDTVTRDQLLEVTTAAVTEHSADATSHGDIRGAVAEHGADMDRHTSAEEKAKIERELAGKANLSQAIPLDADLNNYLTEGNYFIGVGGQDLINIPPTLAPEMGSFSLIVLPNGAHRYGVTQVLITHANAFVFTRSYSLQWSKWKQLATTEDVATKVTAFAPIINSWDELIRQSSGHYIITPSVVGMPVSNCYWHCNIITMGLETSNEFWSRTFMAYSLSSRELKEQSPWVKTIVNGEEFDWFQLATTEPPQEFDLPLNLGLVSAFGKCTYYKDNFGIVTVSINISTLDQQNTMSGNIDIGVLPVGFRPPNSQICAAIARPWQGGYSQGFVASIGASSNGNVSIGIYGNAAVAHGQISFLAV